MKFASAFLDGHHISLNDAPGKWCFEYWRVQWWLCVIETAHVAWALPCVIYARSFCSTVLFQKIDLGSVIEDITLIFVMPLSFSFTFWIQTEGRFVLVPLTLFIYTLLVIIRLSLSCSICYRFFSCFFPSLIVGCSSCLVVCLLKRSCMCCWCYYLFCL